MKSLRKLERDFVRADLATVTGLLARLSDEDVITRIGLEARRDELQQTIADLDQRVDEPAASAALYFGGDPVVGNRGIESEFAAAAVASFQDIVAKVLAQEEKGPLGRRGAVPIKSASTLHITHIVHGSFGFLLEQMEDQPELVETTLKSAVDETTRLLDALGERDEEKFRAAAETMDERVLATARAFFDLMRRSGATLRVVTNETEHSFGSEVVARAADRATSTSVEDSEDEIRGQLTGLLPDAHQFEFEPDGGGQTIIRGRVSDTFSADQLSHFNRTLIHADAIARFRVRRIRQGGELVRQTFTLLALQLVSE